MEKLNGLNSQERCYVTGPVLLTFGIRVVHGPGPKQGLQLSPRHRPAPGLEGTVTGSGAWRALPHGAVLAGLLGHLATRVPPSRSACWLPGPACRWCPPVDRGVGAPGESAPRLRARSRAPRSLLALRCAQWRELGAFFPTMALMKPFPKACASISLVTLTGTDSTAQFALIIKNF